MTTQAQNALLKVLEEPPINVLIILLCNNSQNLLATVKSRAQTIRMQLFSASDLQSYLLSHLKAANELYKSKEKFGVLLEGAKGRIGEALNLLNQQKLSEILSEREIIDGIIYSLTDRFSFSSLFDAFSVLPQKRTELSSCLALLLSALRDLILLKRDVEVPLIYYYDRDAATEIALKSSLDRLYKINTIVQDSLKSVVSNANIQTVITSLITDIKKIRRK